MVKKAVRSHGHSEEYTKYLLSDRWQLLRAEIFKSTNYRCVGCNDKCTDLHHLSYDNLGKEKAGIDVVPLCKKCHKKCHYKKYWDNKKNRAVMTDQLRKKYKILSTQSQGRKIERLIFTFNIPT